MRPSYNGIKYYSNFDWTLSDYFVKSRDILDTFVDGKEYENINEIIELYNIYRIFTLGGIKPEYTQPYSEKTKLLMPIIARFFKSINDESFIDYYHAVCIEYYDDFWTLVEMLKIYEKVSEATFLRILSEIETPLYRIVKHKGIVQYYDAVLAEHMRTSDQTAELIITKFLERRSETSDDYYFPNSLKPTEFESILDKYVDSGFPRVGMLQLLSISNSTVECPISDELKLKAKRRTEKYWNEQAVVGARYEYGVGVRFLDSPEPVTVTFTQPHQSILTFDAKWIRENPDYPTLLNNLIYLFGFTDIHFRCSFPAVQSHLSVLEKKLGVKGKNQYDIGTAFQVDDMKSSAEMNAYADFLSDLNIRIEDVFEWFFTEYLKKEFNVSGFIFHAPSKGTSYLEKCRILPSEMDGVLKQYDLYVRHQVIDRELLEISSKAVKFENLPSMTSNKYIYVNSEEIQREQFLLFSNQSMLRYFPKDNKIYSSFLDALRDRQVAITDFAEWIINDIRWLEDRKAITTDESGVLHICTSHVRLLKDLYDHDVICPSYYLDKTEIERLVLSGNLRYESSLFSIPEQKYLNFMLNKSEYSNGQDLRNRYIHSTYPIDENHQRRDYITLLKIMAVIIIKINEEFCLKYPESY